MAVALVVGFPRIYDAQIAAEAKHEVFVAEGKLERQVHVQSLQSSALDSELRQARENAEQERTARDYTQVTNYI